MTQSEKVSSSLKEVRKLDLNNKIDEMWRGSNGTHSGNKKLSIKLENTGSVKQKLVLKLESGAPNIHDKSYNIISDLLKDFFSNNVQ